MVLFFGRSALSRKWGANIDKIDFFRMWVIWPQKHEKRFLRKFGVRERTFLYIAAPRASMRTLLQSCSANKHWEPAVLFSQCCKPHLENWQKRCLNSTFFRCSARSPHPPTKPSRGWLRVVVRKSRSVWLAFMATRNYVTAKARAYWRGCSRYNENKTYYLCTCFCQFARWGL